MLRCTNCGRIYEDNTELANILEITKKDENGDWQTEDRVVLMDKAYNPRTLSNIREEIFKGCCGCCFDEFLEEITKNSKDFTDEQIEKIWNIFSNVPFVNDDDNEIILESDWFGFLKGTSREDIWHWFDENYSKGVYYLLYELYQDE